MSVDPRASVKQELGEFLAYKNSEQMRQLLRYLDAKISMHMQDLATISEENLKAKQGRIAELQELRIAIIDPGRAGFQTK